MTATPSKKGLFSSNQQCMTTKTTKFVNGTTTVTTQNETTDDENEYQQPVKKVDRKVKVDGKKVIVMGCTEDNFNKEIPIHDWMSRANVGLPTGKES